MYKSGVLAAAFALLFAGAGSLQAQQFSISGGPSFPQGKLVDEARRGYHVQGSVGFELPWLPVDFRTDLLYQNFNNVPREPGINVTLGGEWFRQLGLGVNVKRGFGVGPVERYALVGIGWIREWHDDRSYAGMSHSTFNLNAGIGLDASLMDRLGVFVEARQLNLAGGEALRLTPPAVNPAVPFRSIPVSVGVRF